MVARRGGIDEVAKDLVVKQESPFIFVARYIDVVAAADHQRRITGDFFHGLDQRQGHGVLPVLEIGKGDEVPGPFLSRSLETAGIGFGFACDDLIDIACVGFQAGECGVAHIPFFRVERGFRGGVFYADSAPFPADRFDLFRFPESAVFRLGHQDITVRPVAMVVDRHACRGVLADGCHDVVDFVVRCCRALKQTQGAEEEEKAFQLFHGGLAEGTEEKELRAGSRRRRCGAGRSGRRRSRGPGPGRGPGNGYRFRGNSGCAAARRGGYRR